MATQVGAQLYTLREQMTSPESIRETFRKVSEIGYKAVQVSGVGPMDHDVMVNTVAEAAAQYGLTIGATHVSFDNMEENYAKLLSYHKLWKCEYIGIGAMPRAYVEGGAEGYRRFAKDVSKLARRFKDDGMTLIYHNHSFEFEKHDGKLGLEWLLDECDPALQFELDTFWIQTGGGDVRSWIERVRGRMDVVHFKDMSITHGADNRGQTMAAIGEGNLNWPAIIETCRSIGVRWYFIEQDICPRDPIDCLRSSREYLASLGLQ